MTTPTSPPTPSETKAARPERPSWDPLRWYPDTLVHRGKNWVRDRPWRRRMLWIVAALFVLVVFPGIIGVVATAQVSSGVSQVDGLSWMNVKDSQGVPLANYIFATDKGDLLNPGNTILWTILGVEFIGYMSIVTTAIWIIGFTFSFKWLDMFADALTGVADAFAAQIATPMMLITAVTIGGFFVAWFIVRGFPGKATMQVVTMLGVAVLGPIFLAEPLAEVLSSDGLLSQGRNVGLSVAAGLTGDGNPNPTTLVTAMQNDLADGFARKPVQVWNFGHVVDDYYSCESAWTSAVLSGSDDNIREGMENCNNQAAVAKADNPTMGQVGTGLILLVCATLLLAFAVYLSLKVTKAALNTIYFGFMAIFGFAAGGFIYGPTQTYLVRNVVDGFISAARMAAFTCFLGIYVLFMTKLFEQAPGQVLSVIVIACVVEVVAISQIRRLNKSLDRGNDWVANRFALAIQGNKSGSGGSGSGTALGMGVGPGGSGGGSSLTGLGVLAAMNTINSAPLTGWLMGATPNPLSPLARGKRRSEMANIRSAASRQQMYDWSQQGRSNWLTRAGQRAQPFGGMDSALGLAHALDGLGDMKVPGNWLNAVLLAGGAPEPMANQGLRALAAMNSSMSTNPYGWKPLQKAIAAARAVENHMRPTDPLEARAAFAAQAAMAGANFRRHSLRPRPGMVINQGFVDRVQQHWDSDVALRQAISPAEWNTVGRDTRWAIGNQAARGFEAAANAFAADPNNLSAQRDLYSWHLRLANLEHRDPSEGLSVFDL